MHSLGGIYMNQGLLRFIKTGIGNRTPGDQKLGKSDNFAYTILRWFYKQ
jgi:hypothetical protein